jgi:hypothetical protein
LSAWSHTGCRPIAGADSSGNLSGFVTLNSAKRRRSFILISIENRND